MVSLAFTATLCTLVLAFLSSSLALQDREGKCISLSPAIFHPPSDFYRMSNAKWEAMPRKVPATTLVWEVPAAKGLDNVRLQIARTENWPNEKVYVLNPITKNRNIVNSKDIYIYVRMAYFPKGGKGSNKVKSFKYYVIDILMGCNVDLVVDDQVDYDTIEWSYVVLNF